MPSIGGTRREIEAYGLPEGRPTINQAAWSAYNAFCCALGVEATWDSIDEADMDGWLRLAARVEDVFHEHDGARWQIVADHCRKAFLGHRQEPSPSGIKAIAWEAVAKHLLWILDADVIGDLEEMEQSWRGWTEKKLEKINSPTKDNEKRTGLSELIYGTTENSNSLTKESYASDNGTTEG